MKNIETEGFSAEPLDDVTFARMQGLSYRADCTVPRGELRLLRVRHKNLAGEVLAGEMVCHARIAPVLLDIFRRLYEAGYPIERMELVDNYGAVDEDSMAANNSSCFNFRFISYTTTVSKHGRGLAVDINPLYNPYVKQVEGRLSIEPAAGAPYVDRSGSFPYKITRDDLCCRLFREAGFTWGGDWPDRKDYQHFELEEEEL